MTPTQTSLNKYEYQILTQTWDGVYGAAYNACAEICIEEGWMDHFGFVTAKGHKAIADYENKPKDEDGIDQVPMDFNVDERIDVV